METAEEMRSGLRSKARTFTTEDREEHRGKTEETAEEMRSGLRSTSKGYHHRGHGGTQGKPEETAEEMRSGLRSKARAFTTEDTEEHRGKPEETLGTGLPVGMFIRHRLGRDQWGKMAGFVVERVELRSKDSRGRLSPHVMHW